MIITVSVHCVTAIDYWLLLVNGVVMQWILCTFMFHKRFTDAVIVHSSLKEPVK
jgi:hypothetical protein